MISPFLTVLRQVDHFLRMFHTNADCKGLGFHRNLFVIQYLKSIPGAVTNCEYNSFCIQSVFFSVTGIGYRQSGNFSVFKCKIGYLTVKMYVASIRQNLFTHVFYHFRKYIGTDMWFVPIQNLFRCTICHKDFQYFVIAPHRIFDQRI